MPVERKGGVTFKGNPMTLLGNEIKVGDKAPDFSALATDMSEVTLDTDKGKVRLILSLPSLDTTICDAETRRFNDAVARYPDNVAVYAVSCDLPFAQGRWCGATGVDKVKTLSDHRTVNFGEAYGTWIKELRLLSRAIFLVDENDTVQYVEYVPEIGEHPNYDAVSEAVNKLAS
ncbi:thiol peroxidase [candidate division KSB1 bacterium]|nr:thiol peroxidase [candidate division KSB1 bacterium]